MTEIQLYELIRDVGKSEGIELNQLNPANRKAGEWQWQLMSTLNGLTVILVYWKGPSSSLREEVHVPYPETQEQTDEFVKRVREKIALLKNQIVND
jgi:hypothetical protein